MNDLELKDIPAKLAPLGAALKRYVALIFILAFLGIYGFLVVQINVLSQAEPDEDAVTERLSRVHQPKIDENVIEKIKQLQGQNVEVESLFKQARDNPFTE